MINVFLCVVFLMSMLWAAVRFGCTNPVVRRKHSPVGNLFSSHGLQREPLNLCDGKNVQPAQALSQ